MRTAFCLTALLVFLYMSAVSRIQPAEAMSRLLQSADRISPWMQKLTRRLTPLAKFCC